MVEHELINSKKNTTLEEIYECLMQNKSFVVIGGAGSGKTTILKDAIEKILENLPQNKKILCITYTNVAVNEIKSRINNEQLYVSTFHDFFWNFIKQYQKDVKDTILNLINNEAIKLNLENTKEDIIKSFKVNQINYKHYKKIEKGIISHDEIILLADKLFNKEILKKRFSNIYPYVFIDEFQDTKKEIVDIFINNTIESTIGFFGDPMQSIYDNGVGDLNKYIKENKIEKIFKYENYRNPEIIVYIINKLRITDNLQQKPCTMKTENQKFFLLYSECDNIEYVKQYIENNYCKDIKNNEKTKILYLTHKLIAGINGYKQLYEIYKKEYPKSDMCNDKLFNAECKLILHLIKIQKIINLYKNKDYRNFFELSDFKIKTIEDKIKLKTFFLTDFKNKNIEEIIDYFDKEKLILKDDVLNNFILENEDFYNEIKKLQYSEFINLYGEIENLKNIKSLNATMHSVKGAEFDNILIILNNGNWHNYDFSLLFDDEKTSDKKSIIVRTKKIFYVTLSRTKQNCFVFVHQPNPKFIEKAKGFFGKEYVKEI